MTYQQIVTVDLYKFDNLPVHPRIKYLSGSSIAENIVDELASIAKGHKTVMVILDSYHGKDHVLSELKLYNGFVTRGSYLIVEDTNVNGHPVRPEHGPGPYEALSEFLASGPSFVQDMDRENSLFSFNSGGYLKKL